MTVTSATYLVIFAVLELVGLVLLLNYVAALPF
jgi:hypothetical protein